MGEFTFLHNLKVAKKSKALHKNQIVPDPKKSWLTYQNAISIHEEHNLLISAVSEKKPHSQHLSVCSNLSSHKGLV